MVIPRALEGSETRVRTKVVMTPRAPDILVTCFDLRTRECAAIVGKMMR